MKRLALVVCFSLTISACATKYQPQGLTGGYDEVRLNETTYQITVKGNGYTSNDRARDLALLRAADLTTQAGYERFIVLNGDVQQNESGFIPGQANIVGNTIIATPASPILKPTGSLVIRMVSKKDPAYPGAMDANLIVAQLKPKLS